MPSSGQDTDFNGVLKKAMTSRGHGTDFYKKLTVVYTNNTRYL